MGIWPAFWMLGQNIDSVSWPACGEIDIIEAINNENKVYSTCHWQANGQHAEYGKSTGNFDITNLFSKFLLIGGIFALTKANSYMKELFGGVSTDVQVNISKIKNK